MTRIGIAVAALLVGTAANAQSGLDGVLSRLEAQGFGRFEVQQERDRITIEAHRGRDERELVYNANTGELLRDTIDRDRGRDIPSPDPAGSLGGGVGPAAVLERAGLGAVYDTLRGEGFGAIETEQERGRIKVEARNGRIERELVYDANTGALLRDRVERDDDRRDGSPRQSAILEGAGLTGIGDRLRGEGFSDIDVERERGRIKVEADNGQVERELVYDANTGELLSDRVERDDDDRRGGRGEGASRDDRRDSGRDRGRDRDRDDDDDDDDD